MNSFTDFKSNNVPFRFCELELVIVVVIIISGVCARTDFELTRSVCKDKTRFFSAVIERELKDTVNDNTPISIFRPRISFLSSYDLIKGRNRQRKVKVTLFPQQYNKRVELG